MCVFVLMLLFVPFHNAVTQSYYISYDCIYYRLICIQSKKSINILTSSSTLHSYFLSLFCSVLTPPPPPLAPFLVVVSVACTASCDVCAGCYLFCSPMGSLLKTASAMHSYPQSLGLHSTYHVHIHNVKTCIE